MAKCLMRFSTLMRNVSTFSKFTSTTRFCHSSSDLKEISTEFKDAPIDTKIEDLTPKQLFEVLSDDSDLSRLIKILEVNKTKIDSRHAVLALTTMHKYFEKNGALSREVHGNEHFLSMCSILNHHLTSMELPQIIQSLKILNFIKISSSSMIVQSLLQLLRHSINDLALHQIYYLTYLLKIMEPTPLSSAISISLPAVFMSQLNLKLDKEDIYELKNALRYVSENVTKEETVEYILDVLNDYMNPMDLSTAIDILMSLLKIKNTSNSYYDVLYRVQYIILNEPGIIRLQSVISVLAELCTLIIEGQEQFYNKQLLDKLISFIIAEKCSFSKGAFILNRLNKFHYINIPLLKYLSQLCIENPSNLSECSPLAISSLTTGLAFANFRPPNWDILQEIIVNNYHRIADDATLSYLALRLVSLDCYNVKLLNYIFTIDQNTELMSYHYHQAVKRLFLIVKTLHPTYSGQWPTQKVIDSFRTRDTKKLKLNILLPALEKIVGNPSFIKTRVKTSLGHEIDHLIVVQNGSPITVHPRNPDSTTYVEDFIIPPDSDKIAVLLLPNKAFGRNIPIMEASFSAYIRSLETLSYSVVHVSEKLWKSMYDYEMIPYLKYLLKSSTDNKIQSKEY